MLHQFFEEVPCTSICVRSTTETWSPTNKHSIPYQMIRYIQVSSAFYVRDVRFLNVPSTYWRENTQNVLTRKYQWYSGNFGTGTAGILFWNLILKCMPALASLFNVRMNVHTLTVVRFVPTKQNQKSRLPVSIQSLIPSNWMDCCCIFNFQKERRRKPF